MSHTVKKVALVMDSFYPTIDGPTNVMDKYARELLKRGVEVHVLAPYTGEYNKELPYFVHRCKSQNFKMIGYHIGKPYADKHFLQEQDAIDYDIIHCHSPFYMAKYAVALAKKKDIPIICHFHTLFKEDFLKFTRSKLIAHFLVKSIAKTFNHCTEAWSMNDGCKQHLFDYGFKGKYREMINATELRPLDNIETLTNDLNQKYSLTGCKNVLLYLGRMVTQKNIFFTAKALKIMADNGLDYKMIFAGDGLELEKLKKTIHEYGIDDKVVFTGMVKDRDIVGAIYARAKLFLFPSTYDTSSLVQIEAAAYHTPTLFLKGAITASAVQDGINGFISDPSPEAFAKKVIDICSNDKLYETVSTTCHEQLYLTWDQIGDRVLQAYEEIVANFHHKKKQK